MHRFAPLALAAALLGGLVPSSAAASPFRVRLQRTACFGACPVYSVTVHGDGRVVFVGERFVTAKGVRRATLSKTQVQRLVKGVQQARVFQLANRYDQMSVTDLPSAILTIRVGSRTKRIYHYQGDRRAPKRLATLECLVDRTARTTRWIGRGNSLPCA